MKRVLSVAGRCCAYAAADDERSRIVTPGKGVNDAAGGQLCQCRLNVLGRRQ